jgi:hypothetical protein
MLSFNVDIIKLAKHPPELPIILSGLQQFYYLIEGPDIRNCQSYTLIPVSLQRYSTEKHRVAKA